MKRSACSRLGCTDNNRLSSILLYFHCIQVFSFQNEGKGCSQNFRFWATKWATFRRHPLSYLTFRNGRYYFYRRVPNEYKAIARREYIRISLRTDSRREAMKLATVLNTDVENLWKGSVCKGKTIGSNEYKGLLDRAKNFGFTYMPMPDVASGDLVSLLHRLLTLQNVGITQDNTDALIGRTKEASCLLSEVLPKYMDFAKDRFFNKSASQKKVIISERERNMNLFIKSVGDIPLRDVNRDDVLKFRSYWVNKTSKQNLSPRTANRCISQVKVILETVSENLGYNLDIERMFKRIKFKQIDKQERLPYSTEFIKGKLLSPRFLKQIKEDEKGVIMLMAETGCRTSEATGLLEEDIFLDAPVPYIYIRERASKGLKNIQSERQIPLVGFALEAMKANPKGFPRLYDNHSNFSIAINRIIRRNFPELSEKQTLYSLRHSFQDRILSVNAPDRIQAELMGHKFNRPRYGDGGSLEQKYEWIKKIQLKNARSKNS